MKKILTISTFLLMTFSSFAQNGDSKSYDELMRKSRKARTTSIIMVTTGPVIAVGGIGTLIYGLIKNEEGGRDYYFDANGNYVLGPEKKYTTQIVIGAAATLVGLGVALSSIAFSNKADDFKHEARKAKLNTSIDHILIPGFQNSLANTGTSQYKLSLLIPIGR